MLNSHSIKQAMHLAKMKAIAMKQKVSKSFQKREDLSYQEGRTYSFIPYQRFFPSVGRPTFYMRTSPILIVEPDYYEKRLRRKKRMKSIDPKPHYRRKVS